MPQMPAGDGQAAFIRQAMREKLLPFAEEQTLATAWREQGDTAALHRLVRAYTRLVIATAARYRHYGLPLGDLIQEGNVGLMQAAARFEPAREVRFSTYAAWWIRASLQDYILRNWSVVRTGTTSAQKTLFFNLRRLRARLAQQEGSPSLSDSARTHIATQLGVAVADVAQMELRLAGGDQSLNAPRGETGDYDWQDFLADDRPNPEQVVIGMRDAQARSRWLAQALGTLSARERTIIRERWQREAGATLESLGQRLGISKERVRQLESRALAKLRGEMAAHVADHRDLLLDD